jgi:hypothetical protein
MKGLIRGLPAQEGPANAALCNYVTINGIGSRIFLPGFRTCNCRQQELRIQAWGSAEFKVFKYL